MKNLLYIVLLWIVVGFVSCFDDDSTFGTREVGEIEIAELRDTSIVSYNGNVLRILPKVTTGYPEEEMSYAWYLLSKDQDEGGYRSNPIGNKKELDYEVNLPSGIYTVVFEAMAMSNSFTQTASFELSTSTPFSEGFYILKETTDGNTEVDLLTQDGLVEDLMSSVTGAPLAGKPLSLAVIYDNGYIDDEKLETAQTNMLHVFAEKDYRAFRTEDMHQTFDRSTLMFEAAPDDEIFCTMVQTQYIVCMTTSGMYTGSTGISSGKLGVPEVEGGGSKYVVSFSFSMGGDVYWNSRTHSLYSSTEYGELIYDLPTGVAASSLECIACGLNYVGGVDKGWFLCQGTDGRRLLFTVSSNEIMWGMFDTQVEVSVVVSSKHLAKGDFVAGIGRDAKGIYVVDNGQAYFYNLETGDETPFTLKGLEGEIVYMSNNFLSLFDWSGQPDDRNFNYLVVTTRNGAGYHLYLYDNLVGGVPSGQPIRKVSGVSGVVKSVRYLSTRLSSDDLINNTFIYNGPVFPFGD